MHCFALSNEELLLMYLGLLAEEFQVECSESAEFYPEEPEVFGVSQTQLRSRVKAFKKAVRVQSCFNMKMDNNTLR